MIGITYLFSLLAKLLRDQETKIWNRNVSTYLIKIPLSKRHCFSFCLKSICKKSNQIYLLAQKMICFLSNDSAGFVHNITKICLTILKYNTKENIDGWGYMCILYTCICTHIYTYVMYLSLKAIHHYWKDPFPFIWHWIIGKRMHKKTRSS